MSGWNLRFPDSVCSPPGGGRFCLYFCLLSLHCPTPHVLSFGHCLASLSPFPSLLGPQSLLVTFDPFISNTPGYEAVDSGHVLSLSHIVPLRCSFYIFFLRLEAAECMSFLFFASLFCLIRWQRARSLGISSGAWSGHTVPLGSSVPIATIRSEKT